MREFLKCRTVGLCMTHTRLLNCHVVRATKPVTYTPTSFVPLAGTKTPRDPSHLQKYPEYPDKMYYMSAIGKYLFRHEELRHLRVEQVNRYFAYAGTGDNEGGEEYFWGGANDNTAPGGRPGISKISRFHAHVGFG